MYYFYVYIVFSYTPYFTPLSFICQYIYPKFLNFVPFKFLLMSLCIHHIINTRHIFIKLWFKNHFFLFYYIPHLCKFFEVFIFSFIMITYFNKKNSNILTTAVFTLSYIVCFLCRILCIGCLL